MGLQQHHQVARLTLRLPCLGDLPSPACTQPSDLPEALRGVIEHGQAIHAERLDDAARETRPYAGQGTGAQILLKPFDRFRRELDQTLGPELLAVPPIVHVASGDPDARSRSNGWEVADHG